MKEELKLHDEEVKVITVDLKHESCGRKGFISGINFQTYECPEEKDGEPGICRHVTLNREIDEHTQCDYCEALVAMSEHIEVWCHSPKPLP